MRARPRLVFDIRIKLLPRPLLLRSLRGSKRESVWGSHSLFMSCSTYISISAPFPHLKKEKQRTHSRHVNAFLPSPSPPLALHPPQTNHPSNPSISTTVALPASHPRSSTNALAASYPLQPPIPMHLQRPTTQMRACAVPPNQTPPCADGAYG